MLLVVVHKPRVRLLRWWWYVWWIKLWKREGVKNKKKKVYFFETAARRSKKRLSIFRINEYTPKMMIIIFLGGKVQSRRDRKRKRRKKKGKAYLAAWLNERPSLSTLKIASAMVSGLQDFKGPRSRKRRLWTRDWLVFQHFCHIDCSWYW